MTSKTRFQTFALGVMAIGVTSATFAVTLTAFAASATPYIAAPRAFLAGLESSQPQARI